MAVTYKRYMTVNTPFLAKLIIFVVKYWTTNCPAYQLRYSRVPTLDKDKRHVNAGTLYIHGKLLNNLRCICQAIWLYGFQSYDINSQNDGLEVVQTTNLSRCELIRVSCSNIYLANLEIASLVIVLFLWDTTARDLATQGLSNDPLLQGIHLISTPQPKHISSIFE